MFTSNNDIGGELMSTTSIGGEPMTLIQQMDAQKALIAELHQRQLRQQAINLLAVYRRKSVA
jgi:hypothetical protein